MVDPAVPSQRLKRAADLLLAGTRLLVLAGAGTSADAGVPTFRDHGGYWQRHRVEDLASPEGFARDNDMVWEWYRERREQVACCQPHEGQRTLALLQRRILPPRRVLVATTNEDDLLERAGVATVVHLHGSLFDTTCAAGCGWRARDSLDNGLSFLPCPGCGGPVRPGSVWFGEPLAPGAMAQIEAFDPDAVLVIGSSSLVQPAAAIGPETALAGHPVVEINPVPTPLSQVSGCLPLHGPAKRVLPPLVDLLTSRLLRDKTSRDTP